MTTSKNECKLSSTISGIIQEWETLEPYETIFSECKILKGFQNSSKFSPLKRSKELNVRNHAWDTESVTKSDPVGPFLSGFYDGEKYFCFHSKRVNPEEHRDFFFDYCESIASSSHIPIIWAHYLEWDMGQVFIKDLHLLHGDTMHVAYGDCETQIIFSCPCFGRFNITKDKKVLFRDTFAFFNTSLKRVAETLGVHAKGDPPGNLGGKVFPWAEIGEYFKDDLKSTWHVAEYITDQMKEHMIPSVSVSIPHFASTIFRKSIEVEMEKFPEPKLAMTAFYGGKTRCTPGIYHKAHCYDVNSQYPFAMTKLPKLCCGRYKTVRGYHGPWGVYILKDYLFLGCEFGSLYKNKTKVKNENLSFLKSHLSEEREVYQKDLVVNGWDIESAKVCRSLGFTKMVGWVWEPKECLHENHFKNYVMRFYNLRLQAKRNKNEIQSEFYKLMMNSLYGKFSQLRYQKDKQGWQPGALFDPLVAGWITGFGRCLIHKYEHLYGSVYTSTDSIITTKSVDITPTEELGGLKHEFTAETLVVLRNKVYFAFDENYDLIKCATHALQAENPYHIIKRFGYAGKTLTKKKLVKRKDAQRRGLTVGKLITRTQSLDSFLISRAERVIFQRAWKRHIKTRGHNE